MLSLYFLTDFNNLHTILMRIVSQFQIFIQNWIPTTAARLAMFLKYKVINCSWLINFCWISVNLTRIVSRIWTCFSNQNRTIIAQTAMILVWVIEFRRQNWAGWMTWHMPTHISPCWPPICKQIGGSMYTNCLCISQVRRSRVGGRCAGCGYLYIIIHTENSYMYLS